MILEEFPLPPSGRDGWPWTVEEEKTVEHLEICIDLPRISIITPSFNQSAYIEETIRSVILQGYPNLEYIIIDGGSNDGSLDIIRKYSPWITFWKSEKDRGQSDAINQGFRISDGDLINWLCSDDLLRPGALWEVVRAFNHDPSFDVVAGSCRLQYDAEVVRLVDASVAGSDWEKHPYSDGIWQPSCFFRRSAVAREDLLDEDLHYCMDRDLWCHFVKEQRKWHRSDSVLSHYRYTGVNKSVVGSAEIIDEIVELFNRYHKAWIFLPEILRDIWLPLVLRGMRPDSGLKRYASAWSARILTAGLLVVYPRHHVRNLQREIYNYTVW